jgi:hypothetical protein
MHSVSFILDDLIAQRSEVGWSPNKVTGANVGGPRLLALRTRWAARVAQFGRSAEFMRCSAGVLAVGLLCVLCVLCG